MASSAMTAQLCEACEDLNLTVEDFTTSPGDMLFSKICTDKLGALRESRQVCDLCDLICITLEHALSEARFDQFDDDEDWSLQWMRNTDGLAPATVDEEKWLSALRPQIERTAVRPRKIQFIDQKDTSRPLCGRIVNDTVDVQMMRGWLERCQSQHGVGCRSSKTLSTSLTVVDTQQICLVELPEGESQYATLSYIWGDSNFVTTTLANEVEFQRSGGLCVRLPNTIKDAIEVTRALGIQYLWVDSLCITQDDEARKQLLIEAMGTIYSMATVTLVAATGKGADSGLSGWSVKVGRDLHCIEMSNGFRLGILPSFPKDLEDCEHRLRGWTYQETALSTRCLVFLNGFVYFQCNEALYCEHTNAESDTVKPSENPGALIGKLPSPQSESDPLKFFQRHVHAYTTRRLTYQSDALNAFQGIATSFAPMMGSQKIHVGLPLSCFDWAILWRGEPYSFGHLTRIDNLCRRDGFPSWSWLGWQGTSKVLGLWHDDQIQTWLQQGTWIDWHAVTKTGLCESIWDSNLDGNQVSLGATVHGNIESKEFHNSELQAGYELTCLESADHKIHGSSYGHSIPGNPFGRLTDWKSLSPLLPPTTSTRFERCSVAELETLCFKAPAIDVKLGDEKDPGAFFKYNPFDRRVMDPGGRVSGFLSLHDRNASRKRDLAHLLVISVALNMDLSLHQTAKLTKEIFEAHDQPERTTVLEEDLKSGGPDHIDYNFLNVVWIEQTVSSAEVTIGEETKLVPVSQRIGSGFILRKALTQFGEIPWEDVVLV